MKRNLIVELAGSVVLATFIAFPLGLAAYSDGGDGLGIGLLSFSMFAAIFFALSRTGNKLFSWATRKPGK